MNVDIHLKIAGVLLLALAVMHIDFPKRFRWKKELARLSLLNRQIFHMHCIFILLVLVGCGLLLSVFTGALLESGELSRVVLGGLVVFWGVRLVVQLFVYDSSLWRGNRFNTIVHAGFSVFWTYLTGVLVWALSTVR